MKNRKKIVNGLIWLVLSAALVFWGILGDAVPSEAAAAGTITVAVERFSIGQGYLIEPYLTTFQSGDTYETVCRRILDEKGYRYDTKGASFYLSGISGADAGAISIPSCIQKIGAKKIGIKNVNPPNNSAMNEYAGGKAWLGEFSYSRMSGWMYSVGNNNGHEFPGVGMDGRSPKDGDVFRLQFTVWGYGEDLTGCGYSDPSKIYYPVGNKTALTRKIAQINQNKQLWFSINGCEAAYQHALQVLKKLDATQQELDGALAQLPSEAPVFPDKVTLQETQAVISPGETLKLKAELSPANVNQSALVWSSSDSKVASVDQNGLVTAAGEGQADITVKTQNDKTAVCHVTVKERMITKLILNMDSAYLKVGQSTQIKVERYEPENATEKPEITYTSSDPLVASADEQGKVKALKIGEATITVRTKSGVSAECKIMVGTLQELAQAVETKIKNLPASGQVTDENADRILSVWKEYSALTEEIKEKVSPEAVKTLEKLKQEADEALEKQAQVKNVSKMLEALPSVEKISLSDEEALKKARSAYDSLDTELQKIIEEALKKKLESLEKRMQQLKAEADAAQKETGKSEPGVREPIAVIKITVPSREYVGIGKTISLEVKYSPFNATTDKTLVIKSSDSSIVKVQNSGKLKGIAPGSVNVTVSLKADPSIKAVCKVTVTGQANKLKKSTDQVMKETSGYMLSIDKNPTVGSEWFVLGLARGGKSLKSSYFDTYYNHIANYLEENDGKLTNTVKYTEYSKQILVMTAIGKDARDIAGYNLLENLADFDKIAEQGFNGPIWALIALKCHPDYTIPKVSGVSVQTTEKKLIQYLLDGEISGGGWSLQGEDPDTDITAMTLQALAPYYNKKGYEKVTAAIDRGVRRLSKMQLKTGGFGTMGAETLESNAQVITALCALGIDPQKDARFIKNGRWTVENLISYHISDSGFMHVKAGAATNGGGAGGVVNGMATEQGYYALVAYQRLREGKTSLYDMSDLTAKKGEKGDGTGTGMTDTQNNQQKGNSFGKTAGKTAEKKTGNVPKENSGEASGEKKAAKGWSFSGKTYVPASTAQEETDTETGTVSEEDTGKEDTGKEDTRKEDTEEPAEGAVSGHQPSGAEGPYLAVFILGTALGAGIVSIAGRRRRRKNEKKK
ncbi:MAG: Ig-like domain-containing protein [Blautia sp.]|nr:Ig-like domain-containing protein [Blautia sp.]MDY4516005.1 Ig-like domain-containing protein [Lachnospiraceae bacterium]